MVVGAADATMDLRSVFATTADIPLREKFAYWHDVVCRNLVDLEYQRVGGKHFDAAFHRTPISDIDLCRIQASPHCAERSSTGISRATNATLVFNFVLSGSLIAEQDGHLARLKVGDGTMCDADRPYKLHSNEAFEIACIRIPRQTIASRIGRLQSVSAQNFSERSELAPMVFAYLSRLVERAPKLDSNAGPRVSQNFVELLLALVSEFAETGQPSLTEYRSLALMRVKTTVERSLGQFGVTPATIADELKLSRRYINQLLEAEGTSLSRYIWERRLERCASQLRTASLRRRSVSQIAIENGFNDLSHFSKAFRNRFGASPRAYREMYPVIAVP
jgi:AraC family transcriptional regulator, positive regulator of tynA and feaB